MSSYDSDEDMSDQDSYNDDFDAEGKSRISDRACEARSFFDRK